MSITPTRSGGRTRTPNLILNLLFQAFNGNTALHVVSALQNSRSQVAAVKLLMSRGADPGVRNLENELPWQLVTEGPSGEKVPRFRTA